MSNSRLFLFCLLTLVFSSQIHSSDTETASHCFEHPKTWSNPQITEILKEAEVANIKPMSLFLSENGKTSDFYGQVFLVTLDGGIRAVFKSLKPDELGDAHAEVAAYKASLFLGFPYVPPTVLREIKGMKGSLQLFVPTSVDLLADGEYEKAIREVSAEDNANLRIFYFIFGQWDSGPHNLLAYKDETKTYLIAIDNSGICNHQMVKYGDLPFVRVLYCDKLDTQDYDKPFNFEIAETIANPTAEKLRLVFKDRFPESFYTGFKSYGKQPFKYILYQNGLWRQYHASDEDFVRAHAHHCPQKTKRAIQKLNLTALKQIFTIQGESEPDFLNASYFENILERRDQVELSCEN